MTFASILVHLDDTDRCVVRATFAARLARAHAAHLIGLLPTGLYDGSIPADLLPSGATDFIAESADYLRVRAERIVDVFRGAATGHGYLSFEVRETDRPALDALLHHGRTSDLIVVGQEVPRAHNAFAARDLVDRLLMDAGRPVLVLPCAGDFDKVPTRIMVAWDGSREAALAMQGALPLMRKAHRVMLTSFTPTQQVDAAAQTAGIDRWLHQHGVESTRDTHATRIDVADALLSHAVDAGAELIVMGGYGHARWRERMVGGVTRDMLAHMTVPVLMAH